MMKIYKKLWLVGVLCALIVSMAFPVTICAQESISDDGKITGVGFDDLAGKTVGVMTGTPQDEFVKEKVKDPNILYFNTFTDLALALQEGKIDYYVNSTISYRIMKESNPDFGYLDDVFKSFDVGTIFAKDDKGEKLQKQFNEYIKKIQDDGTLEELQEYWLNPNDWEKVDVPETGDNGTLRFAAILTNKPFCFTVEDGYGGLDTAVIAGFAKEYGYGLDVENVEFSGALSGMTTGKYDLAAGQISYTEERAQSVLYSDFYVQQDIVPIVRISDYQEAQSSTDVIEDADFKDLKGKTVGVLTGTPQDEFVKASVEDPNIVYYNNVTDLALALKEKKIDYFVNSDIVYRIMKESYPEFSYINSVFKSFDIGTIFPKNDQGSQLEEQFDKYIAEIKDNGTLDELKVEWLYPNNWKKVDIPTSGENGTLKFAAISTNKPFCFVIDDGYGGLDTAIVAGFAKEYGYGIEIENVDFAGAISGIASEKYDLAAGQIAYTEERAQSVLYSDFYAVQQIVPIVRSEDYVSNTSKEDTNKTSLWTSFKRTLIDENRYQLILNGLGITLIITVLGFIIANLLGILFCAMSLSSSKPLHVIAEIYSRIMQGTPAIVVLMILYYLVFKSGKISGTVVASVGFGLIYGTYLAQLFQSGIHSVDRGQREAALSLGFTPWQTFKGIVFPQAVRGVLPAYFSQLISLMKGTSIVGYIAVADLTKMGDIIRSTTFEPFFPLIVVALIYFMIAYILLTIMKCIQKKLAPKRVSKEGE